MAKTAPTTLCVSFAPVNATSFTVNEQFVKPGGINDKINHLTHRDVLLAMSNIKGLNAGRHKQHYIFTCSFRLLTCLSLLTSNPSNSDLSMTTKQ